MPTEPPNPLAVVRTNFPFALSYSKYWLVRSDSKSSQNNQSRRGDEHSFVGTPVNIGVTFGFFASAVFDAPGPVASEQLTTRPNRTISAVGPAARTERAVN